MKKISFYLLLVLAVAVARTGPAQTPAATSPPASDDADCDHCHEKMVAAKQAEAEKAVTELEQQWCDAEAAHDAAFLEKVEADTFTFTDSVGRVTTKRDEIAVAKGGGDKIEFKLGDVKAQVYGDAVVLTGRTSFIAAGADTVPGAYRWTDVFVRQASGEWQVVASHASTLAQEKPAR